MTAVAGDAHAAGGLEVSLFAGLEVRGEPGLLGLLLLFDAREARADLGARGGVDAAADDVVAVVAFAGTQAMDLTQAPSNTSQKRGGLPLARKQKSPHVARARACGFFPA